VVVKHARPALERFPQYQVTTERLVFEHRYLEVVGRLVGEPEPVPPRVLHFDAGRRLLVLEDLGNAPDLWTVLAERRAPVVALRRLGGFLARVHTASARAAAELAPQFENREMQELHGEHIFALPYDPDAFPVAPEVKDAADALRADGALRSRIAALRERYYGTREALVHADVQSTNLLLQGDRPRLLDAEIAHFGDPAFDLGTALAHVHFHIAVAPELTLFRAAADALLEGYAAAGGSEKALRLAPAYAGAEMLRRIFGAARVPVADSPHQSRAVLAHGSQLVRAAPL
jgi:5-methylthioribose kinase